MKTFLKEIFEYTYNFNSKVIDSLLQSKDAIPEKSLVLINHTINAHEIWNSRIEKKDCKTQVWEMRPVINLKKINEVNFQNSIRIIDSFNLEERISYFNSKGEEFINTIRDMLFHVVNHSTYHRGQIATDSKLHGLAPLVTDYIFYKRDNL